MKISEINRLINFLTDRGMTKEILQTITVSEFCEFLREKNLTIEGIFQRIDMLEGKRC